MKVHGLRSVGFSTDLRSHIANHKKNLVGRQMIKVLARPTNNTEQFCGQRKQI